MILTLGMLGNFDTFLPRRLFLISGLVEIQDIQYMHLARLTRNFYACYNEIKIFTKYYVSL